MTADGGPVTAWWYTIIVVEFFLIIRILLRMIMLECGGFWRRQDFGYKVSCQPDIRWIGQEYSIRDGNAACVSTALLTLLGSVVSQFFKLSGSADEAEQRFGVIDIPGAPERRIYQ